LRILVPVVVPYPLELGRPPVDRATMVRRLRTIASGIDVPTTIEMIHCRDREQALEQALAANALAVIGWRRRRFLDPVAGLVEKLRKKGVHVVTVEA
jgi:hypothetical protein